MSNRIRVNGNGGDHGLMHNAWYDALIDIDVSESKAKAVAELCAKGVLDNMEISKNFDLLNQKVDNLDVNLNQKIDNLDAKFAAVDQRFDAVYSSISDLKTEFRWIFGFLFAAVGGMSALLIEILSKLN